MEKVFSTLRSFIDTNGKTKFCITCGGMATQEALFDVVTVSPSSKNIAIVALKKKYNNTFLQGVSNTIIWSSDIISNSDI